MHLRESRWTLFLSLVRCWMFLACEPCNRHWFANNDAISERNWEIIGTTGRLHTHTHTFFYSKCVIFFLYFSPHISNSNVSCTWSCKCINQTIIARLNENNVYTFSITNCRLIWYFAAFNSLEALSIVRFAMTFQETGYWPFVKPSVFRQMKIMTCVRLTVQWGEYQFEAKAFGIFEHNYINGAPNETS